MVLSLSWVTLWIWLHLSMTANLSKTLLVNFLAITLNIDPYMEHFSRITAKPHVWGVYFWIRSPSGLRKLVNSVRCSFWFAMHWSHVYLSFLFSYTADIFPKIRETLFFGNSTLEDSRHPLPEFPCHIDFYIIGRIISGMDATEFSGPGGIPAQVLSWAITFPL